MKLFEVFRDITTDVDTHKRRIKENRTESDSPFSYHKRFRGTSADAWLLMIMPHILGFVIGFALTKLIGLEGLSFIVIGGICAFIAGTYKSVAFDKISFAPAVVRNIILMVLLSAVVAVIYTIGSTSE